MSWRRLFPSGSTALLIPVAGALMLLNYGLFDSFLRSIGKEILFTGIRVAVAGSQSPQRFDTAALRAHIAASEFVRPVRPSKSYVYSIQPNEVLIQRVGFLRYHFVLTSPESARSLLVFEIFSAKVLWFFHVSTAFMWLILMSLTWALRHRARKENAIREGVMKGALEAWLRQGEISSFVKEQYPQLVRWWEQRQTEFDQQARALHDIKVPLAALEHAASANANAQNSVQSSVRTIQSIIDLSRQDAADGEAAACDVLEELRAAAAAVQSADPRVKISVRASLARGPLLRGSGGELRRHVSNLLMNAVEASREPLTSAIVVELVAAEEAAGLKIEVRDWGRGIPPRVLARIGKRGFTFGKNKGTGFGVHFCRQWVQDSGGEFTISSEEGRGTTVTLAFPWRAVALEGPRAFAGIVRACRDEQTKIVVFDDDAIFKDIYRMLLAKEGVREERVLWAVSDAELARVTENLRGEKFWIFSDYFFEGTQTTGPEFLRARGLAHRAILLSNVEAGMVLRESLAGTGMALWEKPAVAGLLSPARGQNDQAQDGIPADRHQEHPAGAV